MAVLLCRPLLQKGLLCLPSVYVRGTASTWSQRAAVSTWSPLAQIFNSEPVERVNFRLNRKNSGLFCIPELTDYTGFYLLQENAKMHADALVAEATDPKRKRKIVQVFDELSDTLCCVADMADFVRVAHPDQRYSQAAEEACIEISALVEKLNTNVNIHRALRDVLSNKENPEGDEIDQRVAELFMFDFEQSGIHLEEKKRQEFVQLNENILMLGTYFQQGCQKPMSISKDKLPEHLKYVFAIDGDNVMITGLFSDHHNDMVREAAYKIYLYPDDHQLQLLESMLNARHKLASLVGFPTYAHRALKGTLGETPENIMEFLNTLTEKIRPIAEVDIRDLSRVKARHRSLHKDVMPWDATYYTGIARHERCKIDNLELAPYFSLGSCMEGLSNLFTNLFGTTLRYEEPKFGELWSCDVYKVAVVHEKHGLLGHIYCDLFERPGKPHQDCHFTIRGGRLQDNGVYQEPIVVLMLNLPPPRGRTPSLLTPGMVENLFHEFGHAMHSMLGRTRYQHVTGTRCPTDFAEVPSVLMEYFATDPRVVSTFARHWQTGEPLPEDKIHNLCLTKKMFAASEMQLQVFYSVMDQQFHGVHPLGKSTIDMLPDIQSKYYSLPYVPGTAWHLRFGHFVGYGAKYYAYLMSRAVAARIWHQCFKKDPFNRQMGEHYVKNMLAFGGEKHPSVLVKDMLGEAPTVKMLVNSLLDDVHNE